MIMSMLMLEVYLCRTDGLLDFLLNDRGPGAKVCATEREIPFFEISQTKIVTWHKTGFTWHVTCIFHIIFIKSGSHVSGNRQYPERDYPLVCGIESKSWESCVKRTICCFYITKNLQTGPVPEGCLNEYQKICHFSLTFNSTPRRSYDYKSHHNSIESTCLQKFDEINFI